MAQPVQTIPNSAATGGPARGHALRLRWARGLGPGLPLLAAMLLAAMLLGACTQGGEARQLAEKARVAWEGGRYQDAARIFVTISELYPDSPLAEQALFWAASLYQHYLQDAEQAGRHYQHLTVTFPRGRYFYQAKLSLAEVYELRADSRHRALQVYQQLLLADEMADQRDWLHLKVGELHARMGKMDQARMELRELLTKSPQSELRPQAYYLVGYSYYLERRYDMALYAFRETAKDFAGTPVALRAQYFIADTLEEQGHMRDALKAYTALKDKYPNPDIVELRIKTLQARIRRGVR